MEKEKIDRINYLGRKKKEVGLSEAEATEQSILRAEYIADFKASFKSQLDNTVIVRPDGTREKPKRKE